MQPKMESSFRQRMSKFLNYWYLQYQLHTALYMLDSWEQKVFNTLVVAFVAMASYTAYLYLPGHLSMIVKFIEYLKEPEQADPSLAAAPPGPEPLGAT